MDPEERRKAEEENARRHEREIRKKRVPQAIIEEMEETEEERALILKKRRQMRFIYGAGDEDEDMGDMDEFIKREDAKGNIGEWLQQPHSIRFIRNTFTKLLKQKKDAEGNTIYERKLVDVCKANKVSLEVNFNHIHEFAPSLANYLVSYPEIVLPYLDDVAFELTGELFPNFQNISDQVFIRITDFPNEIELRYLRCENIGRLVKIRGVVTKRTSVYPKLRIAFFTCVKCGEKNGPFTLGGYDEDLNLGSCPICQANGPFRKEPDLCTYKNFQRLTIQESPGTVPPGRVPRQKEIVLVNDLVDSARPGDEVVITGIYKSLYDINSNLKHSFPIFNTFIEANSVKRLNDIEVSELTEQDVKEIKKFGKTKGIVQMIFNSIAPSIYGNEFIKKALAIAMFSGVPKDPQGKHKIRGDINVLLLGDPGTAKSQFLKYIQQVFSRSVYTTGKGASAVGLTAGVHKDPVTKEWTLEGGALVLADKGMCLIDEFDKMNDQDRTSIHEAMEQQSISISKAGIVTTLQSRCSIIAAANPIKGRYDNKLSFASNVELTDPILSRFDILCVVKDEVDPVIDDQLATFVINSHINSHPDPKPEDNKTLLNFNHIPQNQTINQELLKKYILYARQNIHPKINEMNKAKVSKFYSDLRKESELSGGIRITVRHLESLLRIAEALAKMQLNETVTSEDIDLAIQITLESFLQSQKYSIAKNMRKKLAYYLTLRNEYDQLLIKSLEKLARDQFHYNKYFEGNTDILTEVQISKAAFEKDAAEMGIHNLEDFYNSSAFKKGHRLEGDKIICAL
ncbi:MAG: ATP-binding protein [archaeon]|nr:ATP-binding protein [archaeon]